MALSEVKYKYHIKMLYDYNGKQLVFDETNILGFIIDKSYDSLNMPLLYLKVSLDKRIVNYIYDNRDKKFMTIYIDKFVDSDNKSISISSSYIKDQFMCFVDANMKSNIDYDYANKDDEKETVQRIVTIGLMKLDNINNNKKVVTGVYQNEYIQDILLSELSVTKLVLEPLGAYNKKVSINVNNVTTMTKFVKFIADNCGIYNSSYRLYYGLDKTYLLSSSGKGIPTSDEIYNKIIFNVNKEGKSESSKCEGMSIDDNAKAYKIDIDESDIKMNQNTGSSKSKNNIVGIDAYGNTKELDIYNSSDIDTKKKTEVYRMNNLNNINYIKSKVDGNRTYVTIAKSKVDASIFTLNKEYYVRNHSNANYNGKYIISTFQEIYVRNDDSFELNTIIKLRKISN